jgi:hypothetical protein
MKGMNGPSLRAWIDENQVKEEMYWRESAYRQFEFFHELAPVLVGWKRWNKDENGGWLFDEKKEKPDLAVVSTHTSKSILLPVVRY